MSYPWRDLKKNKTLSLSFPIFLPRSIYIWKYWTSAEWHSFILLCLSKSQTQTLDLFIFKNIGSYLKRQSVLLVVLKDANSKISRKLFFYKLSVCFIVEIFLWVFFPTIFWHLKSILLHLFYFSYISFLYFHSFPFSG